VQTVTEWFSVAAAAPSLSSAKRSTARRSSADRPPAALPPANNIHHSSTQGLYSLAWLETELEQQCNPEIAAPTSKDCLIQQIPALQHLSII
jgi:hypothetical protein